MATPPAAPSSVPVFSDEARRRLLGGPQGKAERERFDRERQRLLDEAEALLEAGQAASALGTLERAALMRHAADTELAIVRAQMAAGHYRRALAACAHTAGAHREQPAGTALYAWLLHLGGQEVVARRLLDDALRAAPAGPLLQHTRTQTEAAWPLAGEALRQRPWHAAPLAYAPDAADRAPAGARVIGTATLLADGQRAVVSASLAKPGRSLWLRNGLGETVRAQEEAVGPATNGLPEAPGGVALLALRTVLPAPQWQAAVREPFAGSPGCLVEFAPDRQGRAAWPVLRQGFFADLPGATPSRPLGLAAPEGPRGGPVFDAAGRWAGVALGGDSTPMSASRERLIALATLRLWLGDAAVQKAFAAGGSGPRVGPEVAYELALRGALQVLDDGRGA